MYVATYLQTFYGLLTIVTPYNTGLHDKSVGWNINALNRDNNKTL